MFYFFSARFGYTCYIEIVNQNNFLKKYKNVLNSTKTYFDYKVKQTFMTTKLVIQVFFKSFLISKSRIKNID